MTLKPTGMSSVITSDRISNIAAMARTFLLVGVLLVSTNVMAQISPRIQVANLIKAWQHQTNPRTDATGISGHAFPEANATYWGTWLNFPFGTTITIRGQYPQARYMSFQIYDADSKCCRRDRRCRSIRISDRTIHFVPALSR